MNSSFQNKNCLLNPAFCDDNNLEKDFWIREKKEEESFKNSQNFLEKENNFKVFFDFFYNFWGHQNKFRLE